MNQDELRAAAERVRTVQESEYLQRVSVVLQVADWEQLAHAYLADHPSDSNEPATSEWWDSVKPEEPWATRIDVFERRSVPILAFLNQEVVKTPTRRHVRCLAEACGVKLREKQT